jgi:phage terminase large subunit-like protein
MANDTVILTIGKSENKFVILNRIKGKFTPSETRKEIGGQNDRFSPQIMLVEDNAYQASLQKDMAGSTIVPIRGFTTTGEKYDEFIGINSLAVYFENGQMVIPADPNDTRTANFYAELKEELLSFPSGHTGDTLMALWFAVTAMRGATGEVPVSVASSGLRKSVEME